MQCRRPRDPSPGWEDPLEMGMATDSNILAWRIPWTEEPGGLQSTGSQESNMTEHVISLMYLYVYKHTCILNNLCNLLFYVLLYNVLSHSCNNSKVSTNYTFFYSVKILDYINSMKTRKSELHYKLYMLNYWWLNC